MENHRRNPTPMIGPAYLPAGVDEQHIREILDYYENQTEEEALAEEEHAEEVEPPYDLDDGKGVWIEVPKVLVPKVREFIKAQTA